MDNTNINEGIAKANSKKENAWILITIVLLIISVIAVALVLVLGKDNSSNKSNNIKELINNTLNLESYVLTIKHVDSDFNTELNKYSIEVNKKDNVILDKDASFSTYGKFTINGYEVVENNKFVQEGFDDNYYYYYDGCNVSDSNRGNVAVDIDSLLVQIKDYSFKKDKEKYTHDITNENELKQLISDFDYVGDSQEYLKISLTFSDKYIDTINIELSSRYIEIKISDYNLTEIVIPDEVKKSLAHNYFDFIAYGEDYDDKYYALNRNRENIYQGSELCPDGASKINLVVKSNSGFFEEYIETNDCNGNKEQYEVYIKNTTTNYLISDDHSKDVYIIYDQITNQKIGKLSYDKSNDIIKIYDSEKYNGEFTRRK